MRPPSVAGSRPAFSLRPAKGSELIAAQGFGCQRATSAPAAVATMLRQPAGLAGLEQDGGPERARTLRRLEDVRHLDVGQPECALHRVADPGLDPVADLQGAKYDPEPTSTVSARQSNRRV